MNSEITKNVWMKDPHFGHECLNFDQGQLTIEARPHYCDRGNWYVKVFPKFGSELEQSLDEADGFPRYFFDLDRAKLEMDAWLKKRKLLVTHVGEVSNV